MHLQHGKVRFILLAEGLVCVAVALLQMLPVRGQNTSEDNPPYLGQNSRFPGGLPQRYPDPGFPGYSNNSYLDRIRLAQFKAARAKALVKDTDKLLKLATELNDEVAGSNSTELGKAQLHKASQIAKLAHSVEENMKLTYSPRPVGPVIVPNPFPSQYPSRH